MLMPVCFYALVYGAEWEDIEYFNDLSIAHNQMKLYKSCGMFPFIQEYILLNGRFEEGIKYENNIIENNLLKKTRSSTNIHSRNDSGFSVNL